MDGKSRPSIPLAFDTFSEVLSGRCATLGHAPSAERVTTDVSNPNARPIRIANSYLLHESADPT